MMVMVKVYDITSLLSAAELDFLASFSFSLMQALFCWINGAQIWAEYSNIQTLF